MKNGETIIREHLGMEAALERWPACYQSLAESIDTVRQSDRECGSIWKCDTCGFQVTKSILYVRSGSIGADNRTTEEPCPNDGNLLRRMTWEELFRDAVKVGEAQVDRAVKAETFLRKIKLHCLTTKQDGPEALARIIRLCIDAGITEKLDELKANL